MWEVRRQDVLQPLLIWKRDIEKHTASQKSIRELPFHITGNNDQGLWGASWRVHAAPQMRMPGFDGHGGVGLGLRNFRDVEPSLVQLPQQVVRQITRRLINLIDQDHAAHG